MRRSSLIPPSKEETSDLFEHVSWISFWSIIFNVLKYKFYYFGVFFIAAGCHHYSSKSSLPPSTHCSTYYLELWSLLAIAPDSTYGIVFISFNSMHNLVIRVKGEIGYSPYTCCINAFLLAPLDLVPINLDDRIAIKLWWYDLPGILFFYPFPDLFIFLPQNKGKRKTLSIAHFPWLSCIQMGSIGNSFLPWWCGVFWYMNSDISFVTKSMARNRIERKN